MNIAMTLRAKCLCAFYVEKDVSGITQKIQAVFFFKYGLVYYRTHRTGRRVNYKQPGTFYSPHQLVH